MAGERVKLQVKPRENGGTAVARRLRASGEIPGVLYGDGKKAHPFTVGERELRRVLTGDHGLHAILDVVIEGTQTPHHAVLKEYQIHPTRNRLLHVDLQEVRLDRPIQAQVVVELTGEAQGAVEGGVLQQPLREINVQALPMEIPERIELDVTPLMIGEALRISDLPTLEGVTYLDDVESVVASVTVPTRVEEPEEEVSEEELAEGEELPEGEEPEGAAEGEAESEAEAAGEEEPAEG
ncbi:MAG TPA: 50S ribosomal protein L25 [Gaiellaceae bacterium]|jgi:large subunit ribosomal protein L25